MTQQKIDFHSSKPLQQQLADTLSNPDVRVRKLEHQGQIYWVKKVERLNFRYRIQKGDPRRAFDTERNALHELSKRGVPVPEIVDEGEDYFVTTDSGTVLPQLLHSGDPLSEEASQAFSAAGRTLATLHGNHITHGRPAIKDMCWQGGQLTLLDFERFSPTRNTTKGHVRDLIIFVHSCFYCVGSESPIIVNAMDAYRTTDRKDIWGKAQDWCHKMRWIDWVTKPVQWRKTGRAREFKAIPLTLKAFGVS